MNRINKLFSEKKENILSVYFTAGFPQLNDTVPILKELEASGVDMVEIGIPFSDPVADGSVIQNSGTHALANGMKVEFLFEQLKDIRKEVDMPLIIMSYINPVYQYGMERFCKDCEAVGIDGVILPDLPMLEYQTKYKALFERHGLKAMFLISPQTSESRIREIDSASDAFIYMVASASITGTKKGVSEEQIAYFERVKSLHLKNPLIVGFGISTHEDYATVCRHANGAIVGSAFIRMLAEFGCSPESISKFINSLRK